MLRLIKDGEADSKEKFLSLYQSLGEHYNDLNQELLNGLLNIDLKLSFADHNDASSSLVTPMADLSSFNSDVSPSLESRSCNSTERNTSSRERVPSLKQKCEVEKNESAYLLADIFSGELETALQELEAEKRRVVELERKLSDSTCKIENLESELEECKECLAVSEIEASKLSEMLSECRAEKAKLQKDNGDDLLDSLRAELRLREIQIEQMEEYLNQVCVKDTDLVSESGTDKYVSDRVEELEKQVELQRNVISEREEEKREAIRELCFSLDHYKSRYTELVRSLSGNNN
ncbi:unnamed protein product [Microthlaspi erraticum]|uniref:NAB domain-containing protein n=1 Tax=Microthlaspi erraticum TaxID=1685480 RepID=A0A6D2JND7_9BRAS|nr:unnamed protein product [Microthlaspi erraticum]